MLKHASSYRDRLGYLLVDSQLRGEYLGRYCVPVGNDGQSLYVGEADSKEEHRGSSQRPQGHGDVFEVRAPPVLSWVIL